MNARRGATGSVSSVPAPVLPRSAAAFYEDLRLTPLLRTVVHQSRRLLGGAGGSLSVLDTTAERYTKVAESGVACQVGRSFPADEGVTGEVVRLRAPVVLGSYAELTNGHLPVDHPAREGAAVAVPIWWRGDVVGANVVFAGRRRRFTGREVDDLDVLTQAAAAAIVTAGADTPPLAHLLRRGGHDGEPSRARVAEPGPAAPQLTARELDVLALLTRGLGDREIAAVLGISRKTVEKHVGAVLRKTGTPSRTAAAVESLARGWLDARSTPRPRTGEPSP